MILLSIFCNISTILQHLVLFYLTIVFLKQTTKKEGREENISKRENGGGGGDDAISNKKKSIRLLIVLLRIVQILEHYILKNNLAHKIAIPL